MTPQTRWSWGCPAQHLVSSQLSLFPGLADPAPRAPPKESAGNGQWPLFQVGVQGITLKHWITLTCQYLLSQLVLSPWGPVPGLLVKWDCQGARSGKPKPLLTCTFHSP